MDLENKYQVNEPSALYQKSFRVFTSFDDAEEYGRGQMAKLSPAERMQQLEILRKAAAYNALDSEGRWLPLKKSIVIDLSNDQ